MVGPSGNDRPASASDGAKDRLIRPGSDVLGTMRDRVSEEGRSAAKHSARGLSSYRNCPAFGLLQHAADQLPDRLALVYGSSRWTYRDLNSDAVRAAAMLQRLGVRPGDRVGLLLPNVPEYIIAANAIWRAGGIVLAISPLMVRSEVEALLRKTKCRHVVCLDLLSNLLPDSKGDASTGPSPLRTTLLVSIRKQLPAHEQLGYLIKRGYQWLQARPQGSNNRVGWFWEEIATIERAWQPITIDPASDPAYILPTGGTTGSPKAVTLSHQNMVANAWQQYVWTRRSFGEETMLGVLPFFHSYGMSATVMGGAAMAATLVLHHRFNTNKTIQLIETHRPSVFHAVPAMLVAMNARLREHPSDKLDSLRWIISGGASLEESVAREFTEHCRFGHDEDQHAGPQVVEGFGLSEASPVTHVGHLFKQPIYGRIGLPLPMTECRIIDPNAEPGQGERILADGEVGELCVRGPQVMLGYWGDHEATRMAIRDGWLHTGDLAIRHEDGWYSIVGRKKDLIITSGFNVYPSEVETVLCEAENVKDAAVVAMPDEVRGESVHAYIVTVDGSPPDIEALEEHCRNHLSAHKRPRAYTHCPDDLPRNFLGKVIRRELREMQAIDQDRST
ncbi:Long-chain-fatty-acid--CoA ligase [Stieleria maiorica]|uniref:Long-chain-fatty-acid--CoA ligase n=1 Tax=Stieleria maiorica TaxID=2795974 RepID=A0A5B9MFN9_9BACT|nr:AMP-binding protein [Stieleria maiorica]QEF98840.1 Long-chain-fatty-acid--CoA ligase [Stieleria maiorica]